MEMEFNLKLSGSCKRGKGFWKFNGSLLTDKDYVQLIKNTISHIKVTVNITNKNTLWEYVKCQIRSDTIKFSIDKAKRLKIKETELLDKLEKLEKNLNEDEVGHLEYTQTKLEWENLLRTKMNGVILRSKAKWIEEGEKNTKYFLNLEKRNYSSTLIKTLIDKDEREITDLKEIIEEQKKFYKGLYTSKLVQNEPDNIDYFTEDNNIPKLSNDERKSTDEVISITEFGNALKNLPNNKSPGNDGFTTNFYKFFWPDIKELLYDSYMHTFEHKTLTSNQRKGILNLIPKKYKDLRHLANWRPVSLLNTDYKILTKALAIRLQNVIALLINSDQVGYIKGRYIGENIRIMFDLMSYIDSNSEEALFAQIDFEKAFDSIEWPFLFKSLESYNFGSNFINWIKILYTNIESCVGNNGYYSEFFLLNRSIRQGCPISALLFILTSELIAINIRNDKNIVGIKIGNVEYKISLMADDTTLIVVDIKSLKIALTKFRKFQKCSGLKLNMTKTEIIPLGKLRNHSIVVPEEIKEIRVRYGPFKALGVWFSHDSQEVIEYNYTERLKKIEGLTNIWKSRSLSLKGKVMIIKTIMLPQIQFLFSLIFTPVPILKKIDKILFSFLWDGKTSKIKKSTIISNINEGGLGMIDVYAVHDTAKCSWIRRLFDNNNSKWKTIFKELIGTEISTLNKNLGSNILNFGKTTFHKQVLEAWYNVTNIDPVKIDDILNQYLLYNQHIKINGKIIRESFFNSSVASTLKVSDIIEKNGRILSIDRLNIKINVCIPLLKYNSLISAIPQKWKGIMRENVTKITPEQYSLQLKLHNDAPQIITKNKMKTIAKTNSKELYAIFIKEKTESPTALNIWINIYPFLETLEWNKVFTLPFRTTQEPYLQSFQYKILHRILNTREKLFTWKIAESNKCYICDEMDTLVHHLFSCPSSRNIWTQLESWLRNNLGTGFSFTECEILFGIPIDHNNVDIQIINYFILLGKWYINKCKSLNLNLYFIELLQLLKNKLDCINHINSVNENSPVEWQDRLYCLL